ncbi:hypothetical protein NIES4071_79390 [Calothrix sp. NIES-4071]|nr:hypothetical protein NIES4071_79390 [Calothrix sp. NIES-4071]BAZ62209.1 hypothetical protein NIES4105_79320 [Calothrix sp. NIES-4105]
MIKDDFELSYSKELVSKFEEANRKIRSNLEKQRLDPVGWQLIQESNDALRLKIVAEIVEYEALVAHDPDKPIVLEIESLDALSDLLIKARIAFKIIHKELAVFLRCTEEQVAAFENEDYQNATYVDFLTAMDVFGIKLVEGKFVAKLEDYYKKRLMEIRSKPINIDINMKKAS